MQQEYLDTLNTQIKTISDKFFSPISPTPSTHASEALDTLKKIADRFSTDSIDYGSFHEEWLHFDYSLKKLLLDYNQGNNAEIFCEMSTAKGYCKILQRIHFVETALL